MPRHCAGFFNTKMNTELDTPLGRSALDRSIKPDRVIGKNVLKIGAIGFSATTAFVAETAPVQAASSSRYDFKSNTISSPFSVEAQGQTPGVTGRAPEGGGGETFNPQEAARVFDRSLGKIKSVKLDITPNLEDGTIDVNGNLGLQNILDTRPSGYSGEDQIVVDQAYVFGKADFLVADDTGKNIYMYRDGVWQTGPNGMYKWDPKEQMWSEKIVKIEQPAGVSGSKEKVGRLSSQLSSSDGRVILTTQGSGFGFKEIESVATKRLLDGASDILEGKQHELFIFDNYGEFKAAAEAGGVSFKGRVKEGLDVIPLDLLDASGKKVGTITGATPGTSEGVAIASEKDPNLFRSYILLDYKKDQPDAGTHAAYAVVYHLYLNAIMAGRGCNIYEALDVYIKLASVKSSALYSMYQREKDGVVFQKAFVHDPFFQINKAK